MRTWILIALMLLVTNVVAENIIYGSTPTGPQPFGVNTSGQASITLLAGEDQTLNRLFGGPKGTCVSHTADGIVKASAGMLISINVTNATANDDVIIYDNASAASGTKLADFLNLASGTTVFPNYPAAAANGLYIDLTTGGTIHVDICYL